MRRERQGGRRAAGRRGASGGAAPIPPPGRPTHRLLQVHQRIPADLMAEAERAAKAALESDDMDD